ncbi:MAG: LuxR family transcriptional regulator [Rhizobiales bacterium]|nr:LuxR family transcriptional regulator [Hyphomicrobiales bacterium]
MLPDHDRPQVSSPSIASRADLTTYLAGLSERLGAHHYMLLAVIGGLDRHDARIIASNWVYDAIQLVGLRTLAALALGTAAAPGTVPEPVVTSSAPDRSVGIDGETARLLTVLGHGVVLGLRLHVGRQRYYLVISSDRLETLEPDAIAEEHMSLCYVLSGCPDLLAAASLTDPLTDRERECMYWVSEGKTTDDVAVILGVSANTVNSYIANAIQKLGSSNRAMAIATAIRSGVV